MDNLAKKYNRGKWKKEYRNKVAYKLTTVEKKSPGKPSKLIQVRTAYNKDEALRTARLNRIAKPSQYTMHAHGTGMFSRNLFEYFRLARGGPTLN